MNSFREKLPLYRRQYAAMRTKKARTCFLGHLTATHRVNRKYLIKLLRGRRRYKPRPGRGPSYSQAARDLLATLWRAAGRPCAEYLKPMLEKLAADHAALGHAVPPGALGQVLKMSASTVGRSLRPLRAGGPAGGRNKRAGANAVKKDIPEMPGSHLPGDTPGTAQIDSVALCGGDMSGSFFYIATLTDAATQWFECAPSWNRGAAATARAMESVHARLPFKLNHTHPDNGGEFINALFVQAMKKLDPDIRISRSRPYRKNDNCRIEQKNGSVVREYFGDIRFDRHGHLAALETLCRDIALYTNLFRPCKKLVSKERKDCKGVKYAKRYDAPRTPLDRLADFLPAGDPKLASLRKERDSLNSITLLKSIHSRLRGLVRELSLPPPAGGGIPPPAGGGGIPPSAPQAPRAAHPKPRTSPRVSVSTHLTDAPDNSFNFRCPSLLT